MEQCSDFVNFQCPKHKPFNCFKWHFPNQRRRRPVLNGREGKFNYSSEVYCSKYDEFNGTCPDKDACVLMHKTVGDTEHLYHLRYYKVELCSGNLNAQGHCEKNGLHCAFAHGASDLRQPVMDKQEQKNKANGLYEVKIASLANTQTSTQTKTGTQQGEAVEKGTGRDTSPPLQESPWNDPTYLMNNFKVQECPNTSSPAHSSSPCPHYHSHKDRRRCLSQFKYSSVACPMVKAKDEWGEPGDCDHGDLCNYSHNANETCYHPDVFRSKPCTREQTYGHCIRGTFCPFSHSRPHDPPTSTVINSSSALAFQPFPVIINAIPSSSSSSSVLSNSSSSSFSSSASYKTPVTYVTSNTLANVAKDDKKEEHFYDVLDAISDYNISESTNNSTDNKHTNTLYNNYNTDLSGIPFTNDIAFINPSMPPTMLQASGQLDNLMHAELPMSMEMIQQERIMETTHDLGLLNVGLYEGDDKRRTHPPGFEKKMVAENKELAKLREERKELQKRLAQETMLKDKAVKERDKAVALLETFKLQPPLDDQHLMHYLTEASRFENLTLASLFKLHSKLNEDVTLLNNAMEEALSTGEQRCSRCRMNPGRMGLTCGHSCYCYACYVAEVACPQCSMPVFNC